MFDKTSNKIVLVPLDDSLLSGPEGGLRNLKSKVNQVILGKPNAIMGFPGLFKNFYKNFASTSCVLNLTASTTKGLHTKKVLISTVEEAIRLGMDCVGIHVNITSRYESEMLKIFGDISLECERLGMPLLGIMYPRSEKEKIDENYEELKKEPKKYAELVRHAVRVGVEIGADIIKTQFTGSTESFQSVVESCAGVPVVIAGGPKIAAKKMLNNAYQAIKAGASGVSFGRNIFHRNDSQKYITALNKIVHENTDVDEVMRSLSISPEDLS